MKRGEIWWYEAPGDVPRPWVILMRDEAIGPMRKLLGAPTTSTIRGIPTEVRLDNDDGMPVECVVSLDNTAPMRKALMIECITTLSAGKMSEVCRALATATCC